MENLWTTEAILGGFELAYGLQVNFLKSRHFGINMDSSLLDSASDFLIRYHKTLSFKYIGLLVKANPCL